MRLRVEAARARLRTAVRVIAAVHGLTAVGLVVLNRELPRVYETATGQVVLALVLSAWGIALWWLGTNGRLHRPRALPRRRPERSAR